MKIRDIEKSDEKSYLESGAAVTIVQAHPH
jgi:hypothetical protein